MPKIPREAREATDPSAVSLPSLGVSSLDLGRLLKGGRPFLWSPIQLIRRRETSDDQSPPVMSKLPKIRSHANAPSKPKL